MQTHVKSFPPSLRCERKHPKAHKRRLLPWLATGLILGLLVPVHAVEVGGKDLFQPALPGSVSIGGRLGEKMDLCVTNRLLAQDIESVVAPYRAKTETGGADWRCEYWGKWFTSLALADAVSFHAGHPRETR